LVAPDLAWVEVRDAALRVLVPVALAPLLAAAVVRLAAGLDDEDFEVDEDERFAAGIFGSYCRDAAVASLSEPVGARRRRKVRCGGGSLCIAHSPVLWFTNVL
jgi:hypothetical protein